MYIIDIYVYYGYNIIIDCQDDCNKSLFLRSIDKSFMKTVRLDLRK